MRILLVAIILLTSCTFRDSIYNHKGEVIVEIVHLYDGCYSNITTRVKTKDGYEFNTFKVYNSEIVELTVNDTIK